MVEPKAHPVLTSQAGLLTALEHGLLRDHLHRPVGMCLLRQREKYAFNIGLFELVHFSLLLGGVHAENREQEIKR